MKIEMLSETKIPNIYDTQKYCDKMNMIIIGLRGDFLEKNYRLNLNVHISV